MTFVELPVVPIYWHFPRTIKGYCVFLTTIHMSTKPEGFLNFG